MFTNLHISGGVNHPHGVNGTLTHYQLICKNYLGIDKCAIRIIPSSCIELRDEIYLPRNKYISTKDYTQFYS